MENSKNKSLRTIGFTCGSFDLCHAGHFLMFKECKNHCDYLIVGLQINPSIDRENKNSPIMSMKERFTILQGIKWIDEVIPYATEKDLYELIFRLYTHDNLAVRIIGSDWKGKSFTGHELPIKIIYNQRNHNYSSSGLRKRVWAAEEAMHKK